MAEEKTLVPDEELENVAGGQNGDYTPGYYAYRCPKCNMLNDPYNVEVRSTYTKCFYTCSLCGEDYVVSKGDW